VGAWGRVFVTPVCLGLVLLRSRCGSGPGPPRSGPQCWVDRWPRGHVARVKSEGW